VTTLRIAPPLLKSSRVGQFASKQSFFDGMARRQTRADGFLSDTKFLSPARQGLSLTVIRQHAVDAQVVLLLLARCPATIIRTIVAVAVNAIQAVRWAGLWPHVLEEGDERIAPAVADGNAAAPIIRVRTVCGVVASFLHSLPRLIFGALVHPVRGHRGNGGGALQATATGSVSLAQTYADNDNGVPAIAAATPVSGVFSFDVLRRRGLLDNRQLPVAFAGFVFEVCAAARGMMGHVIRSFQRLTTSRGVDAPPAHSIPFVHLHYTTPQNKRTGVTPWPMGARIAAELGVSVDAIITQATEGMR
jgi:hypothetical protein